MHPTGSVSSRRAPTAPPWRRKATVAWVVLWLVTMFVETVDDSNFELRALVIVIVTIASVVLVATWLIGMIATGFALARRSNWPYLRLSVGFVAMLALAWYAMVTIRDPGPDAPTATAVAAGAALVLLLVTIMMGIGAGLGVIVRDRSRRVRTRPWISLSMIALGIPLAVFFANYGALWAAGPGPGYLSISIAPLIVTVLFGLAIASFAGLVLFPVVAWAVAGRRRAPAGDATSPTDSTMARPN